MDWKRDPENGFLIGRDDCHYPNEIQAMHFSMLHLCGCGDPEAAYNFCRDALAIFDRRDKTKEWVNAEAVLTDLIKERPDDAAHVFAHILNHFDLLEHGGSVGGSWLTADGEAIVDGPEATDENMDQEYPEEEPAQK